MSGRSGTTSTSFDTTAQLPFNMRVLDTEGSVPGIRVEHLLFDSTPGAQVHARLYRPQEIRPNQPSAIMLHGGAPRGKDGPNITLNAQFLARAGWNVLAIDLMYFGDRRTDLLTTFTEQEKHERLYNQPSSYLAWVTQTVKDVGRSFDLLVREQKVDPKRVVLIGFSRGAIVGNDSGGRGPALPVGGTALRRAFRCAGTRASPRRLQRQLHQPDQSASASGDQRPPRYGSHQGDVGRASAQAGEAAARDRLGRHRPPVRAERRLARRRMLQWLQNTVK